ncbi:TNF receptor-associated factor 3-like [Ylistrum balloti]|uniref:TNF receptor-associated factor 3-like n=1 Tax=Ylistrum balloti TaxID=509963 RepID=UPI00290596CF|nr:TNF receptor-associated factor 3-like [Ylistrum balloti]
MSDARKVKYLDPPTWSMCCQCNYVLTKPLQLPCGHLVCEECVDGLFGNETMISCHVDKCGDQIFKNKVFPDKHIERKLQNLDVYCTKRENGCMEVMALKDLQNHLLADCGYIGDECQCGKANIKVTSVDLRFHAKCTGFSKPSKCFPVKDFILGRCYLYNSFTQAESRDASIGASILEEHKRMKETKKETFEQVPDLKNQNEEIEKEIQEAQEKLRQFNCLQKKMTSVNDRLNQISRRLYHQERASYNGVFLWEIKEYRQRRLEANEGENSSPFYSSSFGYKMCGRVYLNGDGEGRGTHLSFFFVIMKGDLDALLPWPFQRRVTLTLMDQDTGTRNLSETFNPDTISNNFRRPESEMNVASGIPRFVKHGILETPTYLQNDTIFLKIEVDAGSINEGDASSFHGDEHNVECTEEEGQQSR